MDAAFVLMKAQGVSTAPAPFDYPEDYQLPESKRARVGDGGDQLAAYPDTDAQYGDGGGGGEAAEAAVAAPPPAAEADGGGEGDGDGDGEA